MERNKCIITHPSQLNSLSTLPFTRRSGLGKIVLSDSYPDENKKQMEYDLNKNYYACGCAQGAKAMLIGLLIFGVSGVFGFLYYDWSVTKSLAYFFGGTILTSLMGKLVGLFQANRNLRATVKEIQSVWRSDWPKAEYTGCG